jgi:hypothetical protein
LTACHAATCRSFPEPKTPFNIPLTAHSATWPECRGVSGRPLKVAGEGKRIRESLAVSRGARKQVLDLIERKAAIFQLGRTAFRNPIQRHTDVTQGREPLVCSQTEHVAR